ncbi:MAG: hypothetical protein CBB84_005275 [Phycisphaera sp. TMED24]|nr:MAG: hypothetical protein CBB84_005275 [Phycisphaera sp. TMED24]
MFHQLHIVLSASILLLAATANAEEIITVCASGCEHTSINDAIDAAVNGDVILLSGETYTEGVVVDLDGKSITLRGAVDSDGIPLTILDGTETHRVVQSTGGMITLENLVLQNGAAANGAALNYTFGPLSAINCIFRENVASDLGGAIHAVNGQVTLTGCSFERNSADEYAGAIYGSAATFVLSGCHLEDNQADYVPCVQGENCTFEMSDSTVVNHSGGEYILELGTGVAGMGITRISNCVFENNETEYNLLDTTNNALATIAQLQVTGCIFRGNEVESCINATRTQLLTLSGSLFADNLGDALDFSSVTGSVEDCRFERNSGGGIFAVSGDTTTLDFRRCVWANNVVSFRNQVGGGVVSFDACDFYGNQNTTDGDSRPTALMVGSNVTAVTITNAMFANNGSPAIHTDGELSISTSYLCNQVVEGQTQEQWDDGSNTILSGDAATVCPDGDADGVPDALDLCAGGDDGMDSDVDGTADACDAFPADPSEQFDSDNDGVGDNADAFPDDPSEQFDTDVDGVGDNADDFPNDETEQYDSDDDGVGDNADGCPSDPLKIAPGGCGCGVADTDSDSDLTPDCNDAFPDDPTESADSDGDGVGDNADAFPDDPTEQYDADNDGVGDNSDEFPDDDTESADSDGDGVGDNADLCPDGDDSIDTDFDGTPDCADGCPSDPLKTNPGDCGCGVQESDCFGIKTVCASGCQFTSINDAINAASDGELILLAAETYFEGEPIDLDGKRITLRGVTDTEGNPLSILDGAGTHTVLVAESGETTATVLENLIVQNGLASMWPVDDVDSDFHGLTNGGGLFMYPQALDGDGLFDDATGLTLRNCMFQANVALAPNGNYREGNGGGAFLGQYCQLVLDGCTFHDNTAERDGAGIRCSNSCVLDLDHCLFESNYAGNYAGAILMDDLVTVTIDDCTFRSNTADSYGGALLFEDECTADFTNCSFEGNGVPYTTADGEGDDGEVWDTVDGGALYVQDYSVVTLTSSSFTGNESTSDGGAIDTDTRATIILIDCDFTGNRTGQDGGAVYVSGALLDATDCTFTGNEVTSVDGSSDGGGAIHAYLRDSYMPYNGLALTNCTFTGNQTVDGDPDDDDVAMGGAILIRTRADDDPEPEHDINDCVFSDNVADSGGAIFIVYPDGIDLEGSGNLACGNLPDQLNATPPNLFFDCLADICTDCTDTDGDGVPDFLDVCPGGDDGFDADADGTPDFCDGCPNDSLKTEPGDCGCGVAESVVEGDRDCDGDYDADDVRLAMKEFGIDPVEDTCPADVDGDGSIGFSDVLVILNDWGACP